MKIRIVLSKEFSFLLDNTFLLPMCYSNLKKFRKKFSVSISGSRYEKYYLFTIILHQSNIKSAFYITLYYAYTKYTPAFIQLVNKSTILLMVTLISRRVCFFLSIEHSHFAVTRIHLFSLYLCWLMSGFSVLLVVFSKL